MTDTLAVIVCGGRDYSDIGTVCNVLDSLHTTRPIGVIVQGGASGADTLARHWASSRGVNTCTHHADWKTHGRAAGPLRNEEMARMYAPGVCVVFPGGRGTADMKRRASVHGYEIIEVAP